MVSDLHSNDITDKPFNHKIKGVCYKMKNKKVVIYSIIALGFLVLTFLVDWIFIIGAVILMILNQRELMRKRKRKD